MSCATPRYSFISSSIGVNLPQSSPRKVVVFSASVALDEDAHLAVGQRRGAELVGLVVLHHVMHRHAQLVLRLIEVAELLTDRTCRSCAPARSANLAISISLVSLSPIGLRNSFPKPAHSPVLPNSSLAKFCSRMYCESVSVVSSWEATAR